MTDPSPIRAAVIIPHFDDETRLRRCLAALMPQVTAEVEVVVVDNASPVPPVAACGAHSGVRLVIELAKGAAAARNRGAAETIAPLLFFIDCDCVPDGDWLAVALSAAGRADVVGGEVALFDETAPPRTGAQAFESVFAFDNRRYIEDKGFSVTANLLTRRDVFQATGPFVVGLSEDLDWCHRAGDLGYSLAYAPDLRVSHPTRADWPALARKWRRLTNEECAVNAGRGAPRLRWAAKALAMPLSVLAHAPRVWRHPGLAPSERVAALVTLARLRLARMRWMLAQALG